MTTTTAPVPASGATKKKTAPKPAQYVTKAEFDQVTDVLATIVGKLEGLAQKTATPAEAKAEKEVKSAGADQAPVPSAWDEMAREIVGEAVDHCELFQPRNGGTLFTVVIRPEFSNAPKEYMDRMKVDRRTREIGNEGISGVETWCKLIRQNLKRSAAK